MTVICTVTAAHFSDPKVRVRLGAAARPINGSAAGNQVQPVSYTHLDVYKRQAYRCCGLTGIDQVALALGRIEQQALLVALWERNKRKRHALASGRGRHPGWTFFLQPSIARYHPSHKAPVRANSVLTETPYIVSRRKNACSLHKTRSQQTGETQ